MEIRVAWIVGGAPKIKGKSLNCSCLDFGLLNRIVADVRIPFDPFVLIATVVANANHTHCNLSAVHVFNIEMRGRNEGATASGASRFVSVQHWGISFSLGLYLNYSRLIWICQGEILTFLREFPRCSAHRKPCLSSWFCFVLHHRKAHREEFCRSSALEFRKVRCGFRSTQQKEDVS